jgi:hypothetical protein
VDFFPSELMCSFFVGFAVYSIGPAIYVIHHLCIFIDEGRDKTQKNKKREWTSTRGVVELLKAALRRVFTS